MIDEKKLIEKIEKQIDLNTKCYVKNISDEYSRILDKKIALLKWMINLVKKQPKVNEWILVEERLPKEKEYVLIQNPYGVMSVACLLGGKWYNFQGVELWVAVAWMPLPKEYKKE